MNDYFADKEKEETYWDRIALPLRSNGISHALAKRLSRAQHNGGDSNAIMNNHAPHSKVVK